MALSQSRRVDNGSGNHAASTPDDAAAAATTTLPSDGGGVAPANSNGNSNATTTGNCSFSAATAIAPRVNRFRPTMGPSLVAAVIATTAESARLHALESAAALRIQTFLRMRSSRREYAAVMAAILRIQACYRGHRQRGRLARWRRVEESQRQHAAFNLFATRIQACYRGHRSRRRHDDYYARKRYLCLVTDRSRTVLAASEEANAEQQAMNSLLWREADCTAYARATARVHHTLSTAAVSGIYRPNVLEPVYARGEMLSGTFLTTTTTTTSHRNDANGGGSTDGSRNSTGRQRQQQPVSLLAGTRTTFDTNVEDDIRANAAAARRPGLERTFAANAAATINGSATAHGATVTRTCGDGRGGGGIAVTTYASAPAMMGGDVTVGGVPEPLMRQARHARREQYAQSVRAAHYPTTTTTMMTAAAAARATGNSGGTGALFAEPAPPPPQASEESDESGDCDGDGGDGGGVFGLDGDKGGRKSFAATAPTAPAGSSSSGRSNKRSLGATVASATIGSRARTGVLLPPIQPQKPRGRHPSHQQHGNKGGPSSSSSASAPQLDVPWQEPDSLPPSKPHLGSTASRNSTANDGSNGTGKRKANTAAAAVPARHMQFRVQAHDCADHLAPTAMMMGPVVSGGGMTSKKSRSGGGASGLVTAGGLAAKDGVVFPIGSKTSTAATAADALTVSVAGDRRPLYNGREAAALQRSVDEKVSRSLHGAAVFKA